MQQENNKTENGQSSKIDFVPSDLNTLSSSVIKKHYKKPLVKNTIQTFAQSIHSVKVAVHDFNGWWMYKKDGSKKLYNIIEDKGYSRLITYLKRTLYLTNDFKRMNYPAFEKYQPEGFEIDGFEETEAYTLSIDADLKGDHTVFEKESYDALKKVVIFFKGVFDEVANGKYLLLFSGNGVYLQLHPDFARTTAGIGDDRRTGYRMITTAFNSYMGVLQDEFYAKYPEYKDLVKFDRVNNQNRLIKAPLSLHKTFDHVVYPMLDGEIPLKPLPLTDEDLKKAYETIEGFTENEPSTKDKTKLNGVLEDYIKPLEKEKGEFKRLNISLPEEAIPLEDILKEPFCKAVFDHKEWGDGNTRRIMFMASILHHCGWDNKDIHGFINNHTKDWQTPDDLERLIKFKTGELSENGVGFYPPGYDNLYADYEEFPKLQFGDLKDHLPNRTELRNRNPIQGILKTGVEIKKRTDGGIGEKRQDEKEYKLLNFDEIYDHEMRGDITFVTCGMGDHKDLGLYYSVPLSQQSYQQIVGISLKMPFIAVERPELITDKVTEKVYAYQGTIEPLSTRTHLQIIEISHKLHRDGNFKYKTISELFDHLFIITGKYTELQTENDHFFITLWIIGTYLRVLFTHYPYLVLFGLRDVGKSTSIELLSNTCFNGTGTVTTGFTESRIIREVSATKGFVCIDHYEEIRKSKEKSQVIDQLLEGAWFLHSVHKMTNKDNMMPDIFHLASSVAIGTRSINQTLEEKGIILTMVESTNDQLRERSIIMYKDPVFENIQRECMKTALVYQDQIKSAYEGLEVIGGLGREFNKFSSIFTLAKVVDHENDNKHDLYNKMVKYAIGYRKQRKEESDDLEEEILKLIISEDIKKITYPKLASLISEKLKISKYTYHSARKDLKKLGVVKNTENTRPKTIYIDIERAKQRANQRGINITSETGSKPENSDKEDIEDLSQMARLGDEDAQATLDRKLLSNTVESKLPKTVLKATYETLKFNTEGIIKHEFRADLTEFLKENDDLKIIEYEARLINENYIICDKQKSLILPTTKLLGLYQY